MADVAQQLLPGVILLRTEASPLTVRAELELSQQTPLVQGHFPGEPVLPGAALLGLVLELWRRAWGEAVLAGIPRVKLLAPLRPGSRFAVELRRPQESSTQLRFDVRCGAQLVSQGTLLLDR